MIKFGGIVIVVDYVGFVGDMCVIVDKFYCIDLEIVKVDFLCVGFVFDGISDILWMLFDDYIKNVFDLVVCGKIDWFVFCFKKLR